MCVHVSVCVWKIYVYILCVCVYESIKKELDLCERCSLSTYISWNNVFCITTTHRQKRMYSFVVARSSVWLVYDCSVKRSFRYLSVYLTHSHPSVRLSAVLIRSFVILFAGCFFCLFVSEECFSAIVCDRFDRRSVFPMNGDFSTKLFILMLYFHLTLAFGGLSKGMWKLVLERSVIKLNWNITHISWMVTKSPNRDGKHFARTKLSFSNFDVNDRMNARLKRFASIWFSFIENVGERKAELDIFVVYTLYSLALSFASHGILFMH